MQGAESELESGHPEHSGPLLLHELFERSVDRFPEGLAVVGDDGRLSYRELDHRANQLAHYLKKRGVNAGDLVGLYTFRSEASVVAILGILKAGAGYVPIDPAFPGERIRHILDDAGVSTVLTLRDLEDGLGSSYSGGVILLDDPGEIERISCEPGSRCHVDHDERNLCYVIYTSGTTGKPKGVMTENRNTVRFVHAFNEVCRVTPEDRIFHGFSLGFDGSVEEMWLAFSNGASLVIGPQEAGALGNEVAQCIKRHGATFYSTVPTALTMITEDLPSVRVLIVSGEQCPPELIAKWAVNGRRMLNVYGPTEATVNTTAAECRPDQPVTIGKPLLGYDLYLLDPDQKPLPEGEPGELYVGGETLARGYLNQAETTSKTFMDVEVATTGGHKETRRLYRTGDLVQWDENGELLFLRRIDTQVKIRGYRIELAEIEALLLEQAGIQSAVVNVFEDGCVKELAGYVVLEEGAPALERNELYLRLKTKLPSYMLPKFLDVVCDLPKLTSGKVNRRALPDPVHLFLDRKSEATEPPVTATEKSLAEIWGTLFSGVAFNTTDNFFTGLGGHSMLAAQMITRVREKLGFDLALREVYKNPTLGELAAYLDTCEPIGEAGAEAKRDRPTGGLERPSVAVIQAFGIYAMYGLLTTIGLGSFYALYRILIHPTLGTVGMVGWITVLFVLSYPALVLSGVFVKWAVIGRYKPGAYPIGSSYYLRWWFVTRYQALTATGALSGTPLMSLYYRLMGAKVGKGCVIDSGLCACFDLVDIGEGTCIGYETQLLGSRVENGYLKIGRVSLGKNSYVGIHSTLGLNVSMGERAKLDNLTLLPDGGQVPDHESWSGSPGVSAEVSVPAVGEGAKPKRPILFGFLHLLQIYTLFFVTGLSALPATAVLYGAWLWGSWGGAVCAIPVAAVVGLLGYCAMVVVVKFLVMPKTKPGVYPVESWFYLRKWFLDNLFRSSRVIALPLYTTIYFPAWLRMLGARIGKFAELSTVSQFSPDLMRLGERSFFADGSIIGGRRYYNGMVEVGISEVGDRSFIGNSAMLPINRPVGNDSLIGCLSLPPVEHGKTPDGTDWLGSPSFGLPHRQKVGGFDESVTFSPTRKLIFQRCLVDAMRIAVPIVLGLSFFCLYLAFVYFSYSQWGGFVTFILAPAMSLLIEVLSCLMIVVYKRVLLGKIEAGNHPLWSMFVWLNEAVNGAYESVVAPTFGPMLGTPFFAPYLRLLGCKIGKDVYLGTTLFSEWDLVEIGDHVALNAGTVVQNHLFEDRVMKASHLKIGDHCSVGNMAVVLYDTKMKEGAELAPLSLLMKGETVAEGTRWCGIPTAPDTVSRPVEPEPVLEKEAESAVEPGAGKRMSSIDLLRGVAVLGILFMNIRSFAGPDIGYFNPPELGSDALWNRLAYYFTHIFADQKFMAIFSILFGAGMILLSQKLRESGRSVIGLLSLRYFWLFVIGMAHFFLFWNGDVLAVYAVCALPLLLLMRLQAIWQFGLGLVIFLLPVYVDLNIQNSLATLDEDSRYLLSGYWQPSSESLDADAALHLGSWSDQIQARWEGETSTGENHGEDLLITSVWGNFLARSLGMMLIGMALFRWNILSGKRGKCFYRRFVWMGFGIGIPLALYGIEGNLYNEYRWDYSLFLGRIPNHLATIPIAMAYIGLVMLWSQSNYWTSLRLGIAKVGRIALTCYLGQTVVCMLIFYGIGFGIYGEVDYLAQLVFVVVIGVMQILFASSWLNLFRYGPFEWLWRKLSTGVKKPPPSI